jgi:hypothetical protein
MPVPSPDPTDLTDLATVERFLGLPPGNQDEPLLQGVITAVSAEIETYCERVFMMRVCEEVRNGNGRDTMSLLNAPCWSVGALLVDGIAIAPAPDAVSGGYVFDSESIRLRGAAGPGTILFTRGQGNVKIELTAGYFTPGQRALGLPKPAGVPSLPADLQMAATEMATLRYRQSKRWGDTGFGIGAERVNYFVGEMAAATRFKLERYRRVVPVEP